MADRSNIEWTDATWNPVTGCSEVSPGCAHCYAKTFAERWRGIEGHHFEQGFDLRLWHKQLDKPLKWTRPRKIFVNSMSDLFHEDVPDSFIDLVFAVMAAADHHVFQILTKRPERMRDYLLHRKESRVWESLKQPWPGDEEGRRELLRTRIAGATSAVDPLPNVWLGVSIENRRFVQRADLLRETPAAVRFISAEPLLGPLIPEDFGRRAADHISSPGADRTWSDGYTGPMLDLTGIDWLIAGGESGPGFRRVDAEWVRALRDYTRLPWPGTTFGPRTAFFFKQWGGFRSKAGGRELDGEIWDEFPKHMLPSSFNSEAV